MGYKGVIFDLFHTLTGPESEWGSLPDTSKVLGVEQNAWNEALVEGSKWRLLGQERDALTIIRRLAHSIDPTIPEETIGEAKQIREQSFARLALGTNRVCKVGLLVGSGFEKEGVGLCCGSSYLSGAESRLY
ncbi:MAG: hypothetical protein E2P05_09085 [Acidobacteria bacterium]|nr:MAG: hypothetical protein E2P05_09085 [Acidobacteriota bacterium]